MISLLRRHLLAIRQLLYVVLMLFSCLTTAATYNLSSGSYPPCNTSWSVSGFTYTCNGNGRVTLSSGDIVIANNAATIRADDGFILGGNNSIGSSSAPINLTSSYGAVTASNSTIFGNVNAGSGLVTLTNTAVNGTLTSVGNINLTGGSVSGLVRSVGNVITTNGTNLGGGAMAQSGMNITGGTIAGNFVMTANNNATFSGVTMTNGSISGASTVIIQGGSTLGSGSSPVTVSSNSGPITVNGSTVYGTLTAPGYSTVNVINGGRVYGTCIPGSTPTNACNAASPTPTSLGIVHASVGITCAAEPIVVIAYNSAGVEYNPPAGTVVTLSTNPATGVWIGGNTFTFSGTESRFTKYLRQTTPGTIAIRAETAPLFATSSINFVDTALKIQRNSTEVLIDTQIAGQDGNAIAKVVSTNPKTGTCEARVASKILQAGLAVTCNNPSSCVSGQIFSVNGAPISANNNGAAINYSNVNLTFNSNGEAPLTINYSDVGQVTLHGRLTIPESGVDPQITLSASSNTFVVKPHTLKVTAALQKASPYKVNPETKDTGAGFIPAGEKFVVSVQSFNINNQLTPNFGNEILIGGKSVERNKIQLLMGCPERNLVSDPACGARRPDYPTNAGMGSLLIGEDEDLNTEIDPFGTISGGALIPVVWNEVGSFKLEPSLSGSGYLGAGNVNVITPSGVIGRFYPAKFLLTESSIGNSCGDFSYMEHPNMTISFKVEAFNKGNQIVQNYDNKTRSFLTAGIDYVLKDLNADLDESANISNRFNMMTAADWVSGRLTFSDSAAVFKRIRNLSDRVVIEPPFKNSLELGVKLLSTDPVEQDEDMKADKVDPCTTDCDAHSLGVIGDMRFGRLRLDSAFGSGSADLPVNFVTEYWTGSFWARNAADSCTAITRNNIFYGAAEKAITTNADLSVSLSGGTTTGIYANIDPVNVKLIAGDAVHKFTAPGAAVEDSFPVRVNLASFPWLTSDWDQLNDVPTAEQCNPIPPAEADSDCNLKATFSFGNYRGHDRVTYWRERFN